MIGVEITMGDLEKANIWGDVIILEDSIYIITGERANARPVSPTE